MLLRNRITLVIQQTKQMMMAHCHLQLDRCRSKNKISWIVGTSFSLKQKINLPYLLLYQQTCIDFVQ